MKRSKRMQILVDVAKMKEEQAAKMLARQKAKVEADKFQLSQLKDYANQYESERNLLGLNPNLVTNYQHFVNRLDQAINQQKNVIKQSERHANYVLEQWLMARMQTKSMDALQQKHEKLEQKEEDRKEQINSDEFSMRRYLDAGS